MWLAKFYKLAFDNINVQENISKYASNLNHLEKNV